MKNLIGQIEAAAAEQGARQIVAVSVWLGALSQMSAAHFTGHFEDAAAGSLAAGARLDLVASDDTRHANAQDVLLQGIEVEI